MTVERKCIEDAVKTKTGNSKEEKTKRNKISGNRSNDDQSSQLQEDKKSSFQQVQSCSADNLVPNEVSITNRHCYLMSLIFREFPGPSMTKTLTDDLD